jgi:hypothetical protein
MAESLSENIPVRLEEGRISLGLPMSPSSKETRPVSNVLGAAVVWLGLVPFAGRGAPVEQPARVS